MILKRLEDILIDYEDDIFNNHMDRYVCADISKNDLDKLFELDKKGSKLTAPLIGNFYSNGKAGLTKDLNKALSYHLKSFNEVGNIDSALEVAKIYFLHQKKYQKSHDIYKTIAMVNNHIALTALGSFYKKGIYVKKDLSKALEYYQKAFKYGNLSAPIRIAGIYRQQRKYLKSLILLIKTLLKRIYVATTDKNAEERFREM